MPASRSTLVLKFSYQRRIQPSAADQANKPDTGWFSIRQGNKPVKIENIFFESTQISPGVSRSTGLILIRTGAFKNTEPLRLIVTPQNYATFRFPFDPMFWVIGISNADRSSVGSHNYF